MNKTFVLLAAFLLGVMAGCGSNESKTETSTQPAGENTTTQTPTTNSGSSPNTTTNISTDDPAIAVIENENIRFKLHGLNEITPDPSAPTKPAAGKKVYAADISVENLKVHSTSPSEYMLTSYILDDKGNKISLAAGSVKLATLVSNAQADKDNQTSETFGRSNLATGEKLRGTHYGVEMVASAKPVKWGMVLNGKEVVVDLE